MNKDGFTLLEVLLAMSVLAVIVAMLSLSLAGSIRVFEGSEEDEATYTMAQAAMERLSEDLASAFASEECSFEGKNLLENGHRTDSVEFCSQAHVVFNPKKQLQGPGRIAYRLEPSEEQVGAYRLLRSDQLLVPEQEGGESASTPGFLLADTLRSLQLSYFDSKGQEFDNWQGKGEEAVEGDKDKDGPVLLLPAAVHCILEFWNDAEHTSTVLFSTRVVVPAGVGSGQ